MRQGQRAVELEHPVDAGRHGIEGRDGRGAGDREVLGVRRSDVAGRRRRDGRAGLQLADVGERLADGVVDVRRRTSLADVDRRDRRVGCGGLGVVANGHGSPLSLRHRRPDGCLVLVDGVLQLRLDRSDRRQPAEMRRKRLLAAADLHAGRQPLGEGRACKELGSAECAGERGGASSSGGRHAFHATAEPPAAEQRREEQDAACVRPVQHPAAVLERGGDLRDVVERLPQLVVSLTAKQRALRLARHLPPLAREARRREGAGLRVDTDPIDHRRHHVVELVRRQVVAELPQQLAAVLAELSLQHRHDLLVDLLRGEALDPVHLLGHLHACISVRLLVGLLRCLAGVVKPVADVPLALRRYALNRWQRNARVQTRAVRNGQIFHATGPLRLGRDIALKLLGHRLLDMPWLYAGA